MNRNENSIKAVRILEPGDLTTFPGRHVSARCDRPALGGLVITVRICICCGDPMVERGNALSRNPNVCASCSSLADGMEEEARESNATLGGRAEGHGAAR